MQPSVLDTLAASYRQDPEATFRDVESMRNILLGSKLNTFLSGFTEDANTAVRAMASAPDSRDEDRQKRICETCKAHQGVRRVIQLLPVIRKVPVRRLG